MCFIQIVLLMTVGNCRVAVALDECQIIHELMMAVIGRISVWKNVEVSDIFERDHCAGVFPNNRDVGCCQRSGIKEKSVGTPAVRNADEDVDGGIWRFPGITTTTTLTLPFARRSASFRFLHNDG